MIYCISGLGADKRVFKSLDFGNKEIKYIKWEIPQKKESLEDYCKRLIEQIDLSRDVYLVGVSFGGIIAQEIANIIKVKKVIILSSVKSPNEFDRHFALLRKLRLYKFVPARILKWSNKLMADYYFGVKNETESAILEQIINDTDSVFMKWAIGAIMQWKGNSSEVKVIHIHGDKDRIFPVKNIKNYIRIVDGSHFMILNRAEEISDIIKKEI